MSKTRSHRTRVKACGRFDIKKTFMFIDTDYIDGGSGRAFNYNVRLMGKRTTINQVKGTFGWNDR